jgi:hypothetical protein
MIALDARREMPQEGAQLCVRATPVARSHTRGKTSANDCGAAGGLTGQRSALTLMNAASEYLTLNWAKIGAMCWHGPHLYQSRPHHRTVV